MHGVIDRIEDGIAVILIEESKTEWAVKEALLPPGSQPGTVLNLTETADDFSIINIDKEATATAKEKANTLQQKLQSKKKRSKFKRRD